MNSKAFWLAGYITGALVLVPIIWTALGWAAIGAAEIIMEENFVEGFWAWKNTMAGFLLLLVSGLFAR